ncbi:HD domain-containing metal-dependentphosphohydrolase family protein [Striga asiatica]|uniref:HD domain-containing metal-dependentphosphohydrolase family protein n=1 Tax=Striga asiatica TaxID=4170 RepID=A0A5A7Q8M4_STRAF|nr:HD domain-containing metal-dependentphosphohydrolase family protein [Striga asiatica]
MSFPWENSPPWQCLVAKTRDSKPFYPTFATVCGVVSGVIGYFVLQLPMVAPKWVAYPYANEFSWMLMMASFYLEERSRRLIMVAFCNDELSFSSNYCFTSSQDLRLSKHVNDDVYNSIYHDW